LIALIGNAHARDFEMGGDDQYPNSIMAPERGTVPHPRSRTAVRKHALKQPVPALQDLAKSPAEPRSPVEHRNLVVTRGSSGSVLPTPLPKTQLIPPEGTAGVIVPRPLQHEQGPTIIPGTTTAIPNLPHGPESFQDRASRCAHQAGINGVGTGSMPQYMGACAM
jgi:hypothetical protein